MLISGFEYLMKIRQKKFYLVSKAVILSAWKHLVSESKPTIDSEEEKADQ